MFEFIRTLLVVAAVFSPLWLWTFLGEVARHKIGRAIAGILLMPACAGGLVWAIVQLRPSWKPELLWDFWLHAGLVAFMFAILIVIGRKAVLSLFKTDDHQLSGRTVRRAALAGIWVATAGFSADPGALGFPEQHLISVLLFMGANLLFLAKDRPPNYQPAS